MELFYASFSLPQNADNQPWMFFLLSTRSFLKNVNYYKLRGKDWGSVETEPLFIYLFAEIGTESIWGCIKAVRQIKKGILPLNWKSVVNNVHVCIALSPGGTTSLATGKVPCHRRVGERGRRGNLGDKERKYGLSPVFIGDLEGD